MIITAKNAKKYAKNAKEKRKDNIDKIGYWKVTAKYIRKTGDL
jgi:hypothetical protein